MRRLIMVCILLAIAGCASQQAAGKNKKSPASSITFSGGNGESYDSAIVINGVDKPPEGVEAEYRYISKIHGEKDKLWRIDGQTMYREGKNIFDVIEITLISTSQKRIYYFDVSGFPWKRRDIK